MLGLERAPAERRGSNRDRRFVRTDADVELGIDVDAHPVPRNQRILVRARDGHAQHIHVHRRDIMDDRQHEGAAIDHHFFAGKPVRTNDTSFDERR